MSNEDWYRNIEWNAKIKNDFFQRLNKSRSSFNKAQYLRIQASYISNKYPKESKELLLLLLEKYPEEFELAQTYLQLAELEIDFNDTAEAIRYFDLCFQQQRNYKKASTSAHIVFGTWVVEKTLFNEYNKALSIFQEFEYLNHFPISYYKSFGVMAIIYSFQNKTELSKECSQKALEYSEKEKSGFKFHQKLGIVKNKKDFLYKKLVELSKH